MAEHHSHNSGGFSALWLLVFTIFLSLLYLSFKGCNADETSHSSAAHHEASVEAHSEASEH